MFGRAAAGRTIAIARQEVRLIVTGPLFWILLGTVLFGTLSIGTDAFIRPDPAAGGLRPFVNSQFAMAQVFCLTGAIFYGFFASIIAGSAILRDDESRIGELLHSTPLTIAEYVFGKFAGVIAALSLAVAAQVVAAVGFYELFPIADAASKRGPFDLMHTLVPAATLTLPTILIYAGLAFAVGAWRRQLMWVLGVPLLLFVGSTSFLWTWSPPGISRNLDRALMIIEPGGLRWLKRTFFDVDRGIAFYNNEPLTFDATYGLHLLVSVFVPLLAIAAVVPVCRAVARGRSTAPDRRPLARLLGRLRGRPARVGETGTRVDRPEVAAPVATTPMPPLRALGMTTRAPGMVASIWVLLCAEVRSRSRQAILYLFMLMTASTIAEAATSVGAFGAPLLVTAGTLAVRSIGMLTLVLCLVLLFDTVESLARERTTRFDALLFATPLRTGAMIVAKNLASAVVMVAVLLAALASAVVVQVFQGVGQVEVAPLFLVWFLVLIPTFWVWNAFATAVLAITGSRYATYGAGMLALIMTYLHRMSGDMTWLSNWSLWGTLRWSDMGTFSLNGHALLLNRLWMTALAMLLTVVAVIAFERVRHDGARGRFHTAWRRLVDGRRPAAAVALALTLLVSLSLGGMLGAAVLNGFQSEAAQTSAKRYWRENLATWWDFVPPSLRAVDLVIDLEPAQRRMSVAGTYSMENRTGESMTRLPFTVGPFFESVSWTLDGVGAEFENRSRLHILTLQQPLQPGERVEIGFSYQAAVPKGVTKNGGGVSQFILPSGVALHNLRNAFIPTPGYVASIGIDAGNRYEPAVYAESFWQQETTPGTEPARYDTRLTVSAPSAFTVNAVGAKVSEHTRGGRTSTVWESDYPVGAINIVAGRWEERREGDTAVFFHPQHDVNVDAMLDTLVAAREHYSAWFYPYPWRELKLSEFPDLVPNAQGFPTNIPFSEGIGFLTRASADAGSDSARSSETDLAFLVTAHEAAHQWWGNIVSVAEGPGTGHVVEGMAHYAALRLSGVVQGAAARRALAVQMEDHYLEVRLADRERPVGEMLEDNEPEDWAVVYEKGAWVMWMLEQHLGEEAMLDGLRSFVHAQVATPRAAYLQDMLAAFESFAADVDAYRAFVDQWFFDVVLPEYQLSDVEVAEVSGQFVVTATVVNVGSGVASVDVAVAHGDEGKARAADPVARQRARLLPGKPQTLSWTVDFAPERIVVDPDVHVLQRNRRLARKAL